MMENVILRGPFGKLKGRFYQNRNIDSPVVLMLYPNLKDNTSGEFINSIFEILKNNNFSVFFFNFEHFEDYHVDDDALKNDEIELYEVVAVLNWLNERCSSEKIIWIFTFFNSFNIGLHVIIRRPEITNYILFSPTEKIKNFNFSSVSPCSNTGLIVYDENLLNFIEEIRAKIEIKTDIDIKLMSFDKSNMLKNINTDVILGPIEEYIIKKKNEDSSKVKKIRKDRRRRKKRLNLDGEKIRLNPIKELDF